MQTFYLPHIESIPILSEEESKHCVRVLRLKVGDVIRVADGIGNFFRAEISDANPKKCTLKILEKRAEEKRTFHLHIAIAPTKNTERFE